MFSITDLTTGEVTTRDTLKEAKAFAETLFNMGHIWQITIA